MRKHRKGCVDHANQNNSKYHTAPAACTRWCSKHFTHTASGILSTTLEGGRSHHLHLSSQTIHALPASIKSPNPGPSHCGGSGLRPSSSGHLSRPRHVASLLGRSLATEVCFSAKKQATQKKWHHPQAHSPGNTGSRNSPRRKAGEQQRWGNRTALSKIPINTRPKPRLRLHFLFRRMIRKTCAHS